MEYIKLQLRKRRRPELAAGREVQVSFSGRPASLHSPRGEAAPSLRLAAAKVPARSCSCGQLRTPLKGIRITFRIVLLLALAGPIPALWSNLEAALPSVVSISPTSVQVEPLAVKTLTSVYSDSDGWQDIRAAYLLVSTASTILDNSAYLYYDQNTNLLYLRDDLNSAWLGGFSPGSAHVIENSQVKLDCAASLVSASLSTLTVAWSLSFKPAYSGKSYCTYLAVTDDSGNSVALTIKGRYTLNYRPQIVSITPDSGSSAPNLTQVFSSSCSDSDGWQNIHFVFLLLNSSLAQSNCFYSYYNQDTNRLYLRNDANTLWLGGFSPGSANIIQNSYVQLDCSNTVVLGSASTLTVSWAITFKSSFLGLKNSYLYISDDAWAYQNWQLKGTWTIAVQSDTTPPSGSILINNNQAYANSSTVTLSLSAQDNAGGSGLGQMQFSNDNLTWSLAEGLTLTKAWILPAGDGPKTVSARFSDQASNWSLVYQDGLILDITAPVFSINPVPTPTNQAVTLVYSSSDNLTPAADIRCSGDNSPYLTEGSYNPVLSACDLANNCSTASLSFVIDTTPPQIIISAPENNAIWETSALTLSGTVDGVAFAQDLSLSQTGANTLTKTAADAAGNSASASITVFYEPGTLIGPAGGQVVSPDAKVRLVIPAGALNQDTNIKVIPITKETLAQAVPQNTSLLSVVECRPYGLVFNQPVEITYTLDRAEIPGTRLELGLYDSIQKAIIPTGQTSTIPADGYSVTFSILHFSTYTALKSLTPQSSPIGSSVKIPLPDLLTGAFSQAIPITVIPGRKGLQPALGLSYRSGGANSWVGLGFSLNPGYIVRSTRLGPPTYDDARDTFYLITDAGSTELVHLIDNLYQARIESSFTKFFKQAADSWMAQTKDGSRLFFGETPDSKESGTTPQGLPATFSWSLTRSQDTNGNYISYTYSKDQAKSYLARIDYTAHDSGLPAANSIDFWLEPRSDVLSSYISGNRIAVAQRLKTIEVKQGLSLVWRYSLEYIVSPDTKRSLLTRVTQSGADGQALPAQTLSYQRAE